MRKAFPIINKIPSDTISNNISYTYTYIFFKKVPQGPIEPRGRESANSIWNRFLPHQYNSYNKCFNK